MVPLCDRAETWPMAAGSKMGGRLLQLALPLLGAPRMLDRGKERSDADLAGCLAAVFCIRWPSIYHPELLQ